MDREIEGVDVGEVFKAVRNAEATAHPRPIVVADIDSSRALDPEFFTENICR